MEKKFCVHCGAEVNPQAVVCVHCGCSIPKANTNNNSEVKEVLVLAIKIFSIIGVIFNAFAIIPLIWCLPLYKSVSKHLKGETKLSVGYKVCVLLFLNIVAGVLLLIEDDI